jgi:hypothetical protein
MAGGRVKIRRLLARTFVIILLVITAVAMYKIGKEYDVILDNKTVTIGDDACDAVEYGTVTIDGDEQGAFDIWAGDRVIKKMTGKNHSLTIKVLNEDDDSVTKTVNRDITLDFDTRANMLSIAAMINEAQSIIIPNPLYSPEPALIPDSPPSPEEGAPEGAIDPEIFP